MTDVDAPRTAGETAWLQVRLAGESYGLPLECTREIVSLRGVRRTALPLASPASAGVIDLRGRLVAMLDLRVMLGLPAMAAEIAALHELLEGRQRDHERWLAELRVSVEEDRPFTLAIDPHECAFGRWYDELRADEGKRRAFTGDDMVLQRVVEAFDAPHQRIHGIAAQTAGLVSAGRRDDAFSLIESTRQTELAAMIELFGTARRAVADQRTQLAVVVEHDGATAALVVDAVVEIARRDGSEMQDAGVRTSSDFVRGAFQRAGQPVLLALDLERLLAHATPRAAA